MRQAIIVSTWNVEEDARDECLTRRILRIGAIDV